MNNAPNMRFISMMPGYSEQLARLRNQRKTGTITEEEYRRLVRELNADQAYSEIFSYR